MPMYKKIIPAVILLLFISVSGFSQCSDNTLSICTFNIQNFGKTKLKDPERIAILAGIIRKYDVVAIQEISDKPGTVPGGFLEIINDNNRLAYQYVCSERTGRQPDDKSYQEQYAYYYDSCKIQLLGQPAIFPDDANDDFVREPYAARFGTREGDFTFVLITIHTSPKEALHEIDKLHDVVLWAKQHYPGEEEVIVLGDFNASCTYASPEELDQMDIRGPGYTWIIPDTAKTNLAASKDCAYDRFVVTPTVVPYYSGTWQVDMSFDSKRISDHYPVWVEFEMSE